MNKLSANIRGKSNLHLEKANQVILRSRILLELGEHFGMGHRHTVSIKADRRMFRRV